MRRTSTRPSALALLAIAPTIVPLHGTPTDRSVDPRPAVRAGSVEGSSLACQHDGRMRRVWVYTPPGYVESPDTTYQLIIAFDGSEYLSEIPLPLTLDTLLATRRAPPYVAVMIDDTSSTARLDELANRAWFAGFLGDEVVPWLRAHWPVTTDPHRVILAGSSAGGLAAAYIALHRSDLFGNVL